MICLVKIGKRDIGQNYSSEEESRKMPQGKFVPHVEKRLARNIQNIYSTSCYPTSKFLPETEEVFNRKHYFRRPTVVNYANPRIWGNRNYSLGRTQIYSPLRSNYRDSIRNREYQKQQNFAYSNSLELSQQQNDYLLFVDQQQNVFVPEQPKDFFLPLESQYNCFIPEQANYSSLSEQRNHSSKRWRGNNNLRQNQHSNATSKRKRKGKFIQKMHGNNIPLDSNENSFCRYYNVHHERHSSPYSFCSVSTVLEQNSDSFSNSDS